MDHCESVDKDADHTVMRENSEVEGLDMTSNCDELEALVVNCSAETSTPIASSCSGRLPNLDMSEDRMRRKLKFFFMNPIEKWQARRKFPYKFFVQVVKIILVTVQLCLFAHSRYKHVNYTWDNRVSFSHLFLRGWDAIREVNSYPPSIGPLALYKIDDFYDTIDYAVIGYSNLFNAIGPYSYTEEDNSMPPPVLCLYRYKEGVIFGFNESYVFNSEIEERCLNLTVEPNVTSGSYSSKEFMKQRGIEIDFSALVRAAVKFSLKTVNFKAAGPITPPDCYRFDVVISFDNEDHDGQMVLILDADPVHLVCKGDVEYFGCLNLTVEPNVTSGSYSSKEFMKQRGIEIDFSALVRAAVKFSLKTVNFKAAGPITPPDCYRFDVVISFDNEDHDGQMVLILDADPVHLVCKGDVEYFVDNRLDSTLRSILNSLVIMICSISLILCSRAIYRAQQLKEVTMNFFQKTLKKDLSAEGRLEFLNMWYIMIIVNDVLIILGSAIKEQIERQQYAGDQWNICSVFLGTGNLLVWFGLLRYLGFFKTYNVIILTLKKAAPNVARYLLCAVLLYAGFTFCGWLILGPYHMKFRSLASTSECLFSLINGDDMYATFSIMSFKSPMLWWYSRIYLYCFISLYIYVVINLFISILVDAYETIKKYYTVGFPKSDLQAFVAACSDEASSGIFRSESSSSLEDLMNKMCCCKNPVSVWTRSCYH